MPEEFITTVEPVARRTRREARPHHARLHIRVRHGVRKPHNWFQLIRFGAVGATGYIVNLAVFAVCVHAIGIDYRMSAVVAWIVSVLNNFWWNRHWTFAAKAARPFPQAVRFFAVSLVTFAVSYGILVALVSGAGMMKVLAQAIAVAAATPLNFVGQKLWSFRL